MLNLMNSTMLNWFITKWSGLFYKVRKCYGEVGQVLQGGASIIKHKTQNRKKEEILTET